MQSKDQLSLPVLMRRHLRTEIREIEVNRSRRSADLVKNTNGGVARSAFWILAQSDDHEALSPISLPSATLYEPLQTMEEGMRIAVVGATGRVGSSITRTLLSAGHEVRAMSRGGSQLDALVGVGAEPFIGSFDAGTGDLDRFFRDADAAFLMVKTDWGNIHGHYSEVALRFFDALRHSSVKHAVSMTSMGSEVRGSTGHFQPFYQLDQILDRLEDVTLTHLQAGWFMENLLGFMGAIAEHDRIAWSLYPDVKTPWVATNDIATFALDQLLNPSDQLRVVHQLGTDYSMADVAAILSRELGRPLHYRFIDRNRPEVQKGFLQAFGSLERWLDDTQTMAALNDGRVRFGDDRPTMPTTMGAFVRNSFVPRFESRSAERPRMGDDFFEWMANDNLALT